MATLTLLDFSSGDCELSIDLYCEVLTSRQAEVELLALPDETPVTLKRAYGSKAVQKNAYQTNVGDLRTWEHGWWGW